MCYVPYKEYCFVRQQCSLCNDHNISIRRSLISAKLLKQFTQCWISMISCEKTKLKPGISVESRMRIYKTIFEGKDNLLMVAKHLKNYFQEGELN